MEEKNIEIVTSNEEKPTSLFEKTLDKVFNIDKDVENVRKLSNAEGLDKLGQQILDSDLPIDEKADMYYKHCDKTNEDTERSIKNERSIFNGKVKTAIKFIGGAVAIGTTIWLGKESDTVKNFLGLNDDDDDENDNCLEVS